MEDRNKHDIPAANETPPEDGVADDSVTDQENAVDVRAIQERKLQELNDKYLRLYAEFENYRKRISREKEELVKYGNESLLYELLPVIDNLELALKHVSEDANSGLVKGVEITLNELRRVLGKFGLTRIEASGQEFDPAVHHAMTQVEREDMDEKMVAEELRAGYLYRDKVLRPSLVAVSVRPKTAGTQDESVEAEEETGNEI